MTGKFATAARRSGSPAAASADEGHDACAADDPAVSIIVPAYGVAQVLGETLASLQAQTRTDWEAIVVDDGSPDDVVAAFAPFAGDPRLRLLQTDNRGVSSARNRGIAIARAPLIAFLDGDDRYEPEYLQRMLAALAQDPGAGFVACDARLFGPGETGDRRYSSLFPIAGPLTLARVITRETHVFVAVVARREALDAVGAFDPDLKASEDLDLWLRLLAAGWRGHVLPEALVRYRRGRSGSLSSSARRLRASACQMWRKQIPGIAGAAERRLAEQALAREEQLLRWMDGEAQVLRGEVAAGLALLHDADARSWRWRLALPIMRAFPRLSQALLQLRPRLPQLSVR